MTDHTHLLREALSALDDWQVAYTLRQRIREALADSPAAAEAEPARDISDLTTPEAYYISGPYPDDGSMSVCELAGRVVVKFRPGDVVMVPARGRRYVTVETRTNHTSQQAKP